MLHFQHATTAERQRPLRKYTLISVLLILVAGTSACWWEGDDPKVLHAPTPVAEPALIPTITPVPPSKVSGPVAVSNIPFPTPTITPIPAPPTPVPTVDPGIVYVTPGAPTPTPFPWTEEDQERMEAFYDSFISISHEASIDIPAEFAEGGYPVTATVSGWMTMRTGDTHDTQSFQRIDMTKPVNRSIEIVGRPNTLSVYLHDLDADKWYFIPENSPDDDEGPLRDIYSFAFMAMLYSTVPRDSLQQVTGGYIWKAEGTAIGSMIVTYDQAYNLETMTVTDPNGKQIIQTRYFDLNKLHFLVPYKDVDELLPDTYWKSQ